MRGRGVDSLVVQDLVDGAIPPGECESVDSKSDEAEMTERSECQQPPEIALYQGEARAIEDPYYRERD